MPQTEKVVVKLPSGEIVNAVVPAGMDDAQVGALMRQKHPEYFVDAQQKKIRNFQTESAQQPAIPEGSESATAVASTKRGFSLADTWRGFAQQAGSMMAGTPTSPGLLSPEEVAAGKQFSEQLKTQGKSPWNPLNYLGEGNTAGNMARTALQDVKALNPVAPALNNPNRSEGVGESLANLLMVARNLPSGVSRMITREATGRVPLLGRFEQFRKPTWGQWGNALANDFRSMFPAKPTAPTGTAGEVSPAAVDAAELVSAGRNLGLRPEEAQARAREAVSQFPNDRDAAIQYMAGRKAPAAAPTTNRNPLASVSGGSNPQPVKIPVNRAEDLADIKARVDMLRQELALEKARGQGPSSVQAGETRRAASLPTTRDVTASRPGSAIAEVNTPPRSYVAKNKATMQRMEDAAKVRETLAARGVVAPTGSKAADAQAALVQELQQTPAGQKGGWGGKRAGAGRPKKAGAAEPISGGSTPQATGEAGGIQDRVQAKYGKNYDLPKPEQGMGSHWLFPDGTSSGGDSGDVSHADMIEHAMRGATEENFTKSTGAVRVLLARDGTLRPPRDVANIDAFGPINDVQMTKLANAASQFRWELYRDEGPSQTGVGDFRAFSDAVRKYYEAPGKQ